MRVQAFVWPCLHSLGRHLEVELLGHVVAMSNTLRDGNFFSTVAAPFSCLFLEFKCATQKSEIIFHGSFL